MTTDVHIIGAGIHPFGRHAEMSGLDLAVIAVREALNDAKLDWADLQFAFGGSFDSGNADALLPRLGLTGMQFINVLNGCATGGSALLSSYLTIKSGEFDVGLVVGFDKHARGAFGLLPAQWGMPEWYGQIGLMQTIQFFGTKIQRYAGLHGIDSETLGRVSAKAFRNGFHAEHAWRREEIPLEVILNSAMVTDPLTKFMYCSPSEGAVALIVASDKKMRELGARGPRLRGISVRTRREDSFEVFTTSLPSQPTPSPTVDASAKAYEMAGVGPKDIDFAQLQDTDAGAEIMMMAENGFCQDGEQVAWLRDGRSDLGGQLPINTDGGCIACGEPIGATGLRQIYETVIQLRGDAGSRQVEHARLGYTQVYGAPGLSAVSILER